MRKVVLVCVAILVVLCQTASAEKITLKPTFFSSWKYSADGHNYVYVGTSGDRLSKLMRDYPRAQAHMRAFLTLNVYSYVAFAGGAITIMTALQREKPQGWENKHYFHVGAGAVVVLLSFACKNWADNHIKKAVEIYNTGEQALDLNVGFGKSLASSDNKIQLSLNWRF